ncbi:MAG: transglycosylase domain-containing protein [Lachnospiraceae bacterium]|nr:transglycosylase domain-containing protein [Lachnospiraceae bacterium]
MMDQKDTDREIDADNADETGNAAETGKVTEAGNVSTAGKKRGSDRAGRKKNRGGHDTDKKRAPRKRRRRIAGVIAAAAAVCIIIGLVRFVPLYREVRTDVYNVLTGMDDSSFVRAGNTVILASDDSVIAEVGNEQYTYISITDISDYITNGYIAREDQSFPTHNGISIRAIARAAAAYVRNRGTITQGGSTITQQLVKNSLLTQEQTFERKLTEIVLALQIEKTYNKAQIMEYYCNYNYYGNGCYGVEGASQYYFGKSASDVTLAEAATLVATSNAPSACNPVADYDATMEKKNLALDDMLECGYITQEEHDAAVQENPVIVQETQNTELNTWMVTYTVYCAALKLMENDGFAFQYTFSSQEEYDAYEASYSAAYTEAYESVITGGYTISTSLDPEIQEQLQLSVDETLADFTDREEDGTYEMQAAAVCIDNETQMVVAIVGGRDEEGEYNRGFQAERQPGSSIKPILDYGPAINEGYVTPGTVLTDQETTVNGYTPKNSSGTHIGSVTVRDALVRSINTIALQLFDMTGQETAMSYLEQLEFSSLTYADMTAMAVSIGGFTNGVTVADMARAYAVIANGGQYTDNDCILSMEDYMGDTVYTASSETEEVYLEDTAFILTDILEGNFEESFGMAADIDTQGQYYAGKTGTTNNNYDAWFCGYSAYYTTAVWIGNDYPADLDFYGAEYPLDVWSMFMNALHEGLEPVEFSVPETISLVSSSGQTRDVDYDTDIYNSRPSGYDYYSTGLLERALEAQAAREEAAREEAAGAAVCAFEEYQITDAETAQGYAGVYQEACDAADVVQDAAIRSSLLERIEYKKNLLDGEVLQTWQAVIDEEEEQEQTELALANELAAQESLELAAETLKTERISLAEQYIDALNACTYYTEHIENLITYGQQALEKCAEYEEYESLSSHFADAASAARSLPEYDSSGSDNIPDPDDVSSGSGSSSASGSSSSSGSSGSSSSGSSSGNSRSGN